MKNMTGISIMSKDRQEGSILVSAIIVTFIISILAGSYIKMSGSEYNVAKRSFYMGASFSLAEGGIDYAIKALNIGTGNGWNVSGSTWTVTLPAVNIHDGASGSLKIQITGVSSGNPVIYSEATVSNPGMRGDDIVRQVKVGLYELSGGSSLGASLFYADERLQSAGNNTLAVMFNSSFGVIGDDYIDPETGNFLVNLDDSLRVVVNTQGGDAADFGNMDVYGYVVTGEGGSVDFNSQGGTFTYAIDIGIDDFDFDDDLAGTATTGRVSDNFYGSFESEIAPAVATTQSTASINFPNGNGAGVEWGDKFEKYTGAGTVLSVPNNKTLNITGDVVLVVEGGGAIDIKGEVNIAENGSLKIYTDGDVNVGGSGVVNQTNLAVNMQLYGTNTTSNAQTFKFHGSSAMTGFVYAPDAIAELKGGGNNGDFVGALVMNQIKITGNYVFIGDAALSDLITVPTGNGGYEVTEWVELTGETSETVRHAM